MLEAHRFLFFLLFLFLIYNIFGDIFQKPRHEETEAATDFRFLFSSLGNRSKTCHRDLITKNFLHFVAL